MGSSDSKPQSKHTPARANSEQKPNRRVLKPRPPARPLTPNAASNFHLLPPDCVNTIFTFLPFRALSNARGCCTLFDGIVTDESFWAQMCADQGIEGTLVEGEVAREPHPLQFTGSPPEPNANNFVPWQLLTSFIHGNHPCSHITVAKKKHFLDVYGKRLRSTAHAMTAHCEKCGMKNTKGVFVCSGCGLCMGSRQDCGCMSKHKCQGVNSSGEILMGIRRDRQEVYCYGCDEGLYGTKSDEKESVDDDLEEKRFVLSDRRCLQTAAARDTRTAVHHFGLFQRNQCPHVDEEVVARVAAWKKNFSCWQAKCDSRCSNPKCVSMRVWICLSCGESFCNDDKDGEQHLTQHAKETHHFVAIALRTLNIWCFSCDRYVGFGGTKKDYEAGLEVRRTLRTSLLSQHTQFPDPVVEDV